MSREAGLPELSSISRNNSACSFGFTNLGSVHTLNFSSLKLAVPSGPISPNSIEVKDRELFLRCVSTSGNSTGAKYQVIKANSADKSNMNPLVKIIVNFKPFVFKVILFYPI